MDPPRPTLEWNDVVNYAFLSEFDLLRDARQDIRSRLWARPASRMAMDLYFKTQRAKEEIQRLNVEIPRVITYIRDERQYLHKKEAEYQGSHPHLSHQIKLYRIERCRFDAQHMQRFKDIAKLCGFTGTIRPGQHIHSDVENAIGDTEDNEVLRSCLDIEEMELDEDEEADEEDIAVGQALHDVIRVSIDS